MSTATAVMATHTWLHHGKLDIHVLKDLEVLIDVLMAHLGSSSHSLLLLVGGVSNRKQILSPSSSMFLVLEACGRL